jgi:hypothetical protein
VIDGHGDSGHDGDGCHDSASGSDIGLGPLDGPAFKRGAIIRRMEINGAPVTVSAHEYVLRKPDAEN